LPKIEKPAHGAGRTVQGKKPGAIRQDSNVQKCLKCLKCAKLPKIKKPTHGAGRKVQGKKPGAIRQDSFEFIKSFTLSHEIRLFFQIAEPHISVLPV
jgi:hypothetical protein